MEWQDLAPRLRIGHHPDRALFVIVKSPNFSARGADSPVPFLQGTLDMLVRKQTSNFRSFGK